MSNYTLIENESVCRSVCRNLENIADWLREKDENISPKRSKRYAKTRN